jgi:SecD/SecF fusion protein
MLHFSRFQTIAILASVLIGLIFALPNVLPVPWQKAMLDTIGAKTMTLGLDLQGGSNVVMEVDQKDLRDHAPAI